MNTLKDALPAFLKARRGRDGGPATRQTVDTCSRRLNFFFDGMWQHPLATMNEDTVYGWVMALEEAEFAPATRTGHRSVLKTFLNWLPTQPGYTESSHLYKLPTLFRTGTYATSKPKVPNEDDVQRVTEMARYWANAGNALQMRDACVWLLSLVSGARSGEITNMTLDAFQAPIWSNGLATVLSTGKTGVVKIRIATSVYRTIERYIREFRPKCKARTVFVTHRGEHIPVHRATLAKGYRRICEAAGLLRPILSHALRHRLGSHLTRTYSAKTAAIWLNHRDWQSAKTAIAFYTHVEDSEMSQAALEMDPQVDGGNLVLAFFHTARQ